MTFPDAIQSLHEKFTSGNDAAVDRSSITREEYEAIVNHIKETNASCEIATSIVNEIKDILSTL